MVVVGFDVGKTTLFGTRVNKQGIVKERYELTNTKSAIKKLLAELKAQHPKLLVVSEATSEYHRPLALICLDLGIAFRLLNPITTKQFTRATVRKKKTDVTDAEIIARLGLRGEGTAVTAQTFSQIKSVTRTAVKLAQLKQSLVLVDHHLEAVALNPALRAEVAACGQRLNEAMQTLRSWATQQSDPSLLKLLMSIPGIGEVTAPVLLAEVGDITRFQGPKSLVAYAGLDSRVKQSGYTLVRNTHLTKRGSPYLRRALYIAAARAERCDEELKATYDRKRAEGKRYSEATIIVARKLLNRVYAVWTRGTPYNSG